MKTLSFIIPVYNEEKRLAKTFASLSNLNLPKGLKLERIIFVDDGSTDATVSRIKKQEARIKKKLNASPKIISYSPNRGKGYAVRAGMLASDSDYNLFFDADMSTPLSEIKKFLPFMEKNTDVIIGTRKNGQSTVTKHQPIIREKLGRVFTLMTQIILNTWVTDFTCGFKAFSKDAKDKIFAQSFINRWGYDAELIYLARRLGYVIEEKSVLWANDEGTKVNILRAIPETIIELLKIRINHNLRTQALSTKLKLRVAK